MKKVTICDLKDIKSLEFTIPEKKGVYLIAGANGCGKTTLLVCLDRICNNMAFALGFSSSSLWDMADQYDEAKVVYTVDDRSVSYKKAQARWAPTPKKDSTVLNEFGFSSSAFIKADAQRIAVKQDDLKPGNMTAVDRNVKDALNMIFETDKYDRIMRLKNTNGRGKTSVFFYVIRERSGNNYRYYSEKRFSTGELAMVRLVEKVEQVENGSMILLDEAELALHPKVQVKLLDYLKDKAEQKNLWVFISTHSPTMLKETDKEHIFLLKKYENINNVITPCYPAQAIGEVDFTRTNIYDYIFFVEDEKAVEILKKIIAKYTSIKTDHKTALYNIIPVGGFYETARLAVYTFRRVFASSKVEAIVDEDAFEELDSKPKFKELLNKHKDIIKALPFTPEVWLINQIEKADKRLKKIIIEKYNVELTDIISNHENMKCNSPKPRIKAKAKYNVVLDILSEVDCRNREKIDSEVISFIIDLLSESEILEIANNLFS